VTADVLADSSVRDCAKKRPRALEELRRDFDPRAYIEIRGDDLCANKAVGLKVAFLLDLVSCLH
jgi:hypothetical protein